MKNMVINKMNQSILEYFDLVCSPLSRGPRQLEFNNFILLYKLKYFIICKKLYNDLIV